MAAIQIAPVAERAGIAAGTVYRYFPGKIDWSARWSRAWPSARSRRCGGPADAAPGPLSALAAAIATFAARALRDRKLAWAVIAEPVDAETDAVRQQYRRALAGEIEARIRAAIDGGHLPEQDAALAALGAGRRAARRLDRPAGAGRHRRSGRARAKRCRR